MDYASREICHLQPILLHVSSAFRDMFVVRDFKKGFYTYCQHKLSVTIGKNKGQGGAICDEFQCTQFFSL